MESKSEQFKNFSESTGMGLIPLHGKIPIEKEWQRYCVEKRPFNPDDFKNGINAGIPCGPANGILALDVDDLEKFAAWLKEHDHKLPETRTHMTGKGRPHYIYGHPKNGKRYGNASISDPHGAVDPDTGKLIRIFDIRGIGGQVVAPGSIHPDTGKPYTVRHDIPIAPAPQWLLDLCVQNEPRKDQKVVGHAGSDLEGLQIPYATRRLIEEGEATGRRSEAMMSVLNALERAGADDGTIIRIFDKYPIGEKYREVGNTRETWLLKQIQKCRGTNTNSHGNIAGRVREYLLDGEGGAFKLSELKRELGLNDKDYALARQVVRRMVTAGELEKDGRALGAYRVVNTNKSTIDWDATHAKPSNIILPAGLHDIATIRDGDMICAAGYKNHAKTAFAIETARLNLDNFKVHLFITEYPARMKQRLLDFGVDLHHPNFFAYRIEKSDYIPDKVESGEGVLNIIDHLPNLDNFYQVGKIQDEIHRRLDGAICAITHQKKNPDDKDALGGSFWTITPTLAVTIFMDDSATLPGKFLIRKGKEPGPGHTNITGLYLRYALEGGCQYIYDVGWKRD